jgi:hypothetical protein
MKQLIKTALFAFVGLLLGQQTVGACPNCGSNSISKDLAEASAVVHVRLVSVCPDPDSENGSTTFRIIHVLKSHPLLKGKTEVTYSGMIPVPIPAGKPEFIILMKTHHKELGIFQGITVHSPVTIDYVKCLLMMDHASPRQRLRFYFDYLNDADSDLAEDALGEFFDPDGSYSDLRAVASECPAEKVAEWVHDPKTPTDRVVLYAALLGHCGTAKHAELLRKLLDDPKKWDSSRVDGVLFGYVLLKPKEGWAYLDGILKDQSKDFMLRYAALCVARFFWEWRPDVVSQKDVVAAVMQLLDQEDIADLAIEDLRKWNEYNATDRILALAGKKTHDSRIVRRAILLFALCAQTKNKAAADYVVMKREEDADAVKDAEEVLRMEMSLKDPKVD